MDFLSSSNAPSGRDVMSWERGGGPPSSNTDLYMDRGRPGGSGSPIVANVVSAGKRSPGSGHISSPLAVPNARDESSKPA